MGYKMNPLTALERIKIAPTIYVGLASDVYTRYSLECNAIEKSLKALEIIKKHLYIDGFEIKQNDYEWNLTQEEYELLKELL